MGVRALAVAVLGVIADRPRTGCRDSRWPVPPRARRQARACGDCGGVGGRRVGSLGVEAVPKDAFEVCERQRRSARRARRVNLVLDGVPKRQRVAPREFEAGAREGVGAVVQAHESVAVAPLAHAAVAQQVPPRQAPKARAHAH
jgi:hypothetical protein